MFLLGDVESGKKIHTIPGGRKGTEDRHVGHTAHILCMAISSDGKYLVSSSSSAIPVLILGIQLILPFLPKCDHNVFVYIFLGHWRHEQPDHDLGGRIV